MKVTLVFVFQGHSSNRISRARKAWGTFGNGRLPWKRKIQGDDLNSIASVGPLWLLTPWILFTKKCTLLVSEALYTRAISWYFCSKHTYCIFRLSIPTLFAHGKLLFTPHLIISHKPRVSWNTLGQTLLLILIIWDLSTSVKRVTGTVKQFMLELCKPRTVTAPPHWETG